MLPMTTAVQKPQETLEQIIQRVYAADIMSKEDAQRILAAARDRNFYLNHATFINQAIAVKLAGM